MKYTIKDKIQMLKAVAARFLSIAPIGAGLLIFGLVGLFPILKKYRISKESRSWPVTEAVIIKSGIIEHESRNDIGWAPDINYRYNVNGQDYESGRYTYDPLMVRSKYYAEKIAKKHPAGSVTKIHYNSVNPRQSVIKAGVDWRNYDIFDLWPMLVSIVLGPLILYGITVDSIRRLKKKKKG